MQILLHKRTIYSFVFILVNFFLFGTAFAQTKTWDGELGTNNWGDANNWNPNGVPTATDNVIIPPSVNVNINVANAACASLLLNNASNGNSDSKLIFTLGSILNVSGEITVGKTGGRTGSIDMAAGGSLICGKMTVVKFGTWTPGTGTVEFTSNSTLSSNLTPFTFNNLILSSAANVSLSTDISISGTLTVYGTLNIGTNQSGVSNKVSGAGNFILSTTGTISTSSNGGIDGCITLTGTKTFPSIGGSYAFDAATTAPFPSAWTSPVSITNLTIGGNVTLNKDVNVSGTLTLSAGLLKIPSGSQLVLSSPNVIAGSGFGVSKHIVTEVNSLTGAKGVLQVNDLASNIPYEFPVGNGTYYLPATLTATSPANNFSVTVFQGITKNGEPNGEALTSTQKAYAVDAVWDISRLAGSGNVTMKLSWPEELEGSNLKVATSDLIGIMHHNQSSWESAIGDGDNSNNIVTRSGLTSFSPYGVFIEGMDQILPVHFSNVRVSEKATGIQIEFTNQTESDVAYYEVERSLDGKAFVAIQKLSAAKNNYGSATYTWLDVTAQQGRSTYRIKAVETTGKVVYSSVVSITLGAKTSGLSVYAKGGQVMLQVGSLPAGKYQIQLFSAAGQLLGVESINHAGGSLSQTTSLHTAKTGIYILNISGATRLQQKFMIQ